MAARETYVLTIYRGRAVLGWQWAARLEQLPGGETLRFHDPEALLAHLRGQVSRGQRLTPPPEAAPDRPCPAPTAEEGGLLP